MSLNIHELESDIDLDPLVFKAMINLKYLSIAEYFDDLTKKLNLPRGLLSLPDELRYLCWNCYPSRTLPPNFKPQNLVQLILQGSKLEKLWDGFQNFGSLKVLDLEKSENLIELPNLSQARNVEKICLTGCTKLEYLAEISEPLPKLRVLDLSYSGILDLPKSIYNLIGIKCLLLSKCQNLKSLPTTICKLKHLKELAPTYCSKLEYLPEILEPMPNLRSLNLSGTGIIDLPKSSYNLIGIESLFFNECQNLQSLPTTFCKLKSLKTLQLYSCSKLEYLPEISEPMPNLRYLHLLGSGIIDLPKSIYNLIGLEILNLMYCQNLKSLPTTICKLKSLVQILLYDCSKLEYFPEISEPMQNLIAIHLDGSGIRKLPTSLLENLNGIDAFSLRGCKNLELIPHTMYNKIRLKIIGCPKLKSLPRPLSSGTNLVQHLCLTGTSVSQIPNNLFSCLTFLLSLELSRTNIRRIPENIKFSKLRGLGISGCRFLQSLPELPLTIERVDASGCTSLKMVSNLLTALTQPPTDRVNLGVAFSFMDCLKLEHQNLMSEFQMRASLIATEFALRKTPDKSCPPTTKMCYPGDNIPEWFSYQKKGRSINIRLPCNSNFMGFAFCFILSGNKYYNIRSTDANHLNGVIYVKTFDGDKRHLSFCEDRLPLHAKNHVFMTTFIRDVAKFYSAEEMSFNFHTPRFSGVKIKRCGIRLLHVQDAMEFGIISSKYVCRKSNVVNEEGRPSILEQLRHFQVSSSRKKLCEKIWSSNLNHRYKILWWQLLRDALPVPLPVRAVPNHVGDTSCPLCGSGMESAIHLFLFCKRVRLLWFLSQWHLCTDSLLCDSMASFLEIILDPNYDRDFLIYASLLVDNIWRARYGKVFDAAEIHSSVKAQFNQISTSKREEVEEFGIEEEEVEEEVEEFDIERRKW
ncbi:hypothetical protein TIFTF001_030944 [Ficus carica]|uniref:Uncharacterized protein n=1 Tax=Ficus carica TaxID=3494 RepID=A0AA88J5P3_FICCA|nr:hypothetical protein TIFTF001_030944 [Ficus carica]